THHPWGGSWGGICGFGTTGCAGGMYTGSEVSNGAEHGKYIYKLSSPLPSLNFQQLEFLTVFHQQHPESSSRPFLCLGLGRGENSGKYSVTSSPESRYT
ncbi:hypothetical protein J6590_031186, partial [Homalodisca vitripennis]